jgi:hypothetical protein
MGQFFKICFIFMKTENELKAMMADLIIFFCMP